MANEDQEIEIETVYVRSNPRPNKSNTTRSSSPQNANDYSPNFTTPNYSPIQNQYGMTTTPQNTANTGQQAQPQPQQGQPTQGHQGNQAQPTQPHQPQPTQGQNQPPNQPPRRSWLGRHRSCLTTLVGLGALAIATYGGCSYFGDDPERSTTDDQSYSESLEPSRNPTKNLEDKLIFKGSINGNDVKLSYSKKYADAYDLEVKERETNAAGWTTKNTWSNYHVDINGVNDGTNDEANNGRIVVHLDVEERKSNFRKDNYAYDIESEDPISKAKLTKADEIASDYLLKIFEKAKADPEDNRRSIYERSNNYKPSFPNWPRPKPELEEIFRRDRHRSLDRPFGIRTTR
tara:strand:- start:1394 stop:2431 length:1038 start_codon:yes stop_codon:yes gene_type:complete